MGALAEHTKQSAVASVIDDPQAVATYKAQMRRQGVPDSAWENLRVCTMGKCRVICAVESGRWHLSISHPFRLPTWDEINAARDALIPADVWLCQPMPPKAYWINLHSFCLHLWQIRDHDLIAQWAFDGCQDNQRAEAVADVACRP